ncbi:hypothetical protein AZA_32090 [Nitrospirillum viridazoti Y2]|nr:hypothetical protein AZA_32090 [Nitrospirillum amazonense Y2]
MSTESQMAARCARCAGRVLSNIVGPRVARILIEDKCQRAAQSHRENRLDIVLQGHGAVALLDPCQRVLANSCLVGEGSFRTPPSQSCCPQQPADIQGYRPRTNGRGMLCRHQLMDLDWTKR